MTTHLSEPMPTHATTHIPEWWKETSLGEVVNFVVDNRGKTPPLVGYWYELLEVNAVSDTAREPDYSKVAKFVDEETFNHWFRKWTIQTWDVLIPTVGTIGNASYSKENRGAIAQNLIALRTNEKNNSLFLYYFLTNPNTKKFLLNLDIGWVQPSIKVPHLLNMQVIFPPFPEQVAIADMLSSFDAKIELLREQNETLEKTAQTIFQEWFGKYSVERPEELPEGWRVGKLGEVIDIRWWSTPSTLNPDFWEWTIAWTSPKDLSTSKEMFLFQTESKITQEWLKKASSWLLPIWTLLLSSRAPIWYLAITNIEVAINQGYIAFISWNHFWNKFMYLWLKMNMQTVLSSANGSTFLEISKSSFRNIETIIPSKNTIDEFETKINSMFAKILSNLLQIQSLSRTRDELLPRLMSGEVRV